MRRDEQAGGFSHSHSANYNPFESLQEEEEETYGCVVSIEESLDNLVKATETNATIGNETPTIIKQIGEIGYKTDKVLNILQNGNKNGQAISPDGTILFKWDPK